MIDSIISEPLSFPCYNYEHVDTSLQKANITNNLQDTFLVQFFLNFTF
jgi:hypothetical protein